jgi:hypothetical protein
LSSKHRPEFDALIDNFEFFVSMVQQGQAKQTNALHLSEIGVNQMAIRLGQDVLEHTLELGTVFFHTIHLVRMANLDQLGQACLEIFFGSTLKLGHRIVNLAESLEIARMFAYIVFVVVIAATLNSVVSRLEASRSQDK